MNDFFRDQLEQGFADLLPDSLFLKKHIDFDGDLFKLCGYFKMSSESIKLKFEKLGIKL